MFRRRARNPAQRLRTAVESMPRQSRIAMLRGIESNQIIAGAYADPKTGGVCPMLAAHRNGGRTSLASFARCWDRFTDARRPRLATARELRALRGALEMSLVAESTGPGSLAAAAEGIRAERAARPAPAAKPAPTGERHRGRELRRRRRWSWILPTRRYDVYRERIAAASEQLTEQRAAELLGAPRSPAGRG